MADDTNDPALRTTLRPFAVAVPSLLPRSRFYQGTFGRMFRRLGEHQMSDRELAALARGMREPRRGDDAFDNPDIPAGYTYLGQFIDHDITFDPTSDLQRRNDPDAIENFRTPRFDLDSLYGRGPEDSPFLYDREVPGQLIVSRRSTPKQPVERDLVRNRQETALIGDPRNDENTIIAQLQLAFISFHNAVLTHVGGRGRVAFREAQRLVQWHYQWIVVHDFLRRIAGDAVVDDILGAGPCSRPRLCFYSFEHRPFIPVEFSIAAYRFGHSMVRGAYHLNDRLDRLRADLDGGNIPLFVPRLPDDAEDAAVADLRGGKTLPSFWTIQWNRFLDVTPDRPPQPSRKIDTKLARALLAIPVPGGQDLALRNLRRGAAFGLPSGQAVARAMSIDPLPGERGEDPLWFYVLKEADTLEDGRRLGPVGGRLVAEVFLGLLAGDSQSYLSVEPAWRPTLPGRAGEGSFDLVDLLEVAGMPLTADDLPFPPERSAQRQRR